MYKFLAGDELGNIKSLKCSVSPNHSQRKLELTTLYDGTAAGREKGIQAMAIDSKAPGKSLTAAHANGIVSSFSFESDGSLKLRHEWKEPRLTPGQRFVGLVVSGENIFSCSSNGALQRTSLKESNEDLLRHTTASLPMRLCDWCLSEDVNSFAYGGDEVELSVWDTEGAFTSRPDNVATSSCDSKKRKRGNELLPGEVWRAKNVPNDFLDLRQPVNIASLTYLSSPQQLLTGTLSGNVRRYDTRTARRPIADWIVRGNVGGVKLVERGLNENEVFVSDRGSNLFAMDLRSGQILYGYKGLSGAVSSMSSCPSLLGSTSLDRFFRLHSTHPPPAEPNQRQEQRGEVLDKVYMKTIPTVLIYGGETSDPETKLPEDDSHHDDVWDNMQSIEDMTDDESLDSENSGRLKTNRRKGKSS